MKKVCTKINCFLGGVQNFFLEGGSYLHVHAKGAYKKNRGVQFFLGGGPKGPSRPTAGARSWVPVGPPIF